jgi:hypothetical protein
MNHGLTGTAYSLREIVAHESTDQPTLRGPALKVESTTSLQSTESQQWQR